MGFGVHFHVFPLFSFFSFLGSAWLPDCFFQLFGGRDDLPQSAHFLTVAADHASFFGRGEKRANLGNFARTPSTPTLLETFSERSLLDHLAPPANRNLNVADALLTQTSIEYQHDQAIFKATTTFPWKPPELGKLSIKFHGRTFFMFPLLSFLRLNDNERQEH